MRLTSQIRKANGVVNESVTRVDPGFILPLAGLNRVRLCWLSPVFNQVQLLTTTITHSTATLRKVPLDYPSAC